MIAKKIGTVDFGNCGLNNVLYIPNLRKNLLSVNAITQKEGKVEFYKDEVIISKNKNTIFKGKKIARAYMLYKMIEAKKRQ
ncbi:hypothetical protein X777_01590 [Ooceraea biroi]|uniref:Retrovirus-related Pol polyprotein from transposon TNT 1-94-like beta-barrel domain-containing protein n=1 Tax=Ooceraea biroi TaxID=2015173 RepID=A0A026WQA3_OOCBI|nr:hypothetical protein X777_01590 [Ooceraea biroi]